MISVDISKIKTQLLKLIHYGSGQFVNLIVPFLLSPYLILTCGESNFGKSAIGMTIAFFVIVFVDYGSDILGVKEVSQNRYNKELLNHTLSKIVYSKIVTAFLFAIIYYVTLFFFDIPTIDKSLYLWSGTIFLAQIINPLWFFQGLEDFKNFSLLTIVSKIFYVLFCFLLVKKESDFIYINLSYSLSVVISGFVAYKILKSKYEIEFVTIKRQELFNYFNKHKTFAFSQIFTWFQLYAPILIISFLGNAKLVGQFRLVDQIISVFRTYIMMSFNFIYPKVCYEINQTYNRAIKNWSLYNLINLSFVLLLLVLIYFFRIEIVKYYHVIEIKKIVSILAISLFYPIVFLLVNCFKQLFLALHFQKLFSIITIIMSSLTILSIYFSFPYFELAGVYYSSIFVELFTLIILIILSFKYKIIHTKK
ncbi:oligosaccharide flippase family protein [Flavobacterium sp.]|uniref:oligosaccharide flippase family protein n=1 Tax=Flavobacterium sp. TaxID=239 RepID=UPI0037C07EC6